MARINALSVVVLFLFTCSTYVKTGRRGVWRSVYQQRARLPANYPHVSSPGRVGSSWWQAASIGTSASVGACEKYRRLPRKKTAPAVFGGHVAKEFEFPYMAAIGYNSSRTSSVVWGCGGSLIHERFVLTAGHCITDAGRRGMLPTVLRLGTNIVSDGSRLLSDYAVQKAILHPLHNPNLKHHDVALLRTDRNVRLGLEVRPVCLLRAGAPPPSPGTKALVVGWGSTLRSGYSRSEQLMTAAVRVVAHGDCRRRFERLREASLPHGITRDMICAAHPDRKSGTCTGDSGGPLVLRDEISKEDLLIGISSFGELPCGGQAPAVYSFVAHSTSWIESVVWP